MTLIAAFKEQDVPMLLGDFLITGENKQGTKKKAHVLGQNLAIAWTGHAIVAESVIRTLNGEIRNSTVKIADLERLLTSFGTGDFGALSVTLVGWIVDDEPRCFRWQSSWPSEVFYDAYAFDGSGKDRFDALHGGNTTAGTNQPSDPILAILSTVSRLMADEVVAFRHRQLGFGFGYEIVYWTGHFFKYVSNIEFEFAAIEFNDVGDILNRILVPRRFRYINYEEISLLQRSDIVESKSGLLVSLDPASPPRVSLKTDIHMHAITPLYPLPRASRKLLERLTERPIPLPDEANYKCQFIALMKGANSGQPVPLPPLIIVPSKGEGRRLTGVTIRPANGGDHELQFNLPSDEALKFAFHTLASKLKSEP